MPSYCPTCEKACERNAHLVMLLTRAIRDLHAALAHPGIAADCADSVCRDRWVALREQRHYPC